MIDAVWFIVIVVAFLLGRYLREAEFDQRIKSLESQKDWWRDLYEKNRPSPKPDLPPQINRE